MQEHAKRKIHNHSPTFFAPIHSGKGSQNCVRTFERVQETLTFDTVIKHFGFYDIFCSPSDVQIVFTLVPTHLFLTDFQYSTNWKIPNTTQRPRKSKYGEESLQWLVSWGQKEGLTGLNWTGTVTTGLYSLLVSYLWGWRQGAYTGDLDTCKFEATETEVCKTRGWRKGALDTCKLEATETEGCEARGWRQGAYTGNLHACKLEATETEGCEARGWRQLAYTGE